MSAETIIPHPNVPTSDIGIAKVKEVVMLFNENFLALNNEIVRLREEIEALKESKAEKDHNHDTDYSPLGHKHELADVNTLTDILELKADASHVHGYLSSVPAHFHDEGDVINLVGDLLNKADANHTHYMDEISGLNARLSSLEASIGMAYSAFDGTNSEVNGVADDLVSIDSSGEKAEDSGIAKGSVVLADAAMDGEKLLVASASTIIEGNVSISESDISAEDVVVQEDLEDYYDKNGTDTAITEAISAALNEGGTISSFSNALLQGLGSAAWCGATDFAPANHGHNYAAVDHVHADLEGDIEILASEIEGLAASDVTLAPSGGDNGTSSTASRSDHKHKIEDFSATGCTANCVMVSASDGNKRGIVHSNSALKGSDNSTVSGGDWDFIKAMAKSFKTSNGSLKLDGSKNVFNNISNYSSGESNFAGFSNVNGEIKLTIPSNQPAPANTSNYDSNDSNFAEFKETASGEIVLSIPDKQPVAVTSPTSDGNKDMFVVWDAGSDTYKLKHEKDLVIENTSTYASIGGSYGGNAVGHSAWTPANDMSKGVILKVITGAFDGDGMAGSLTFSEIEISGDGRIVGITPAEDSTPFIVTI